MNTQVQPVQHWSRATCPDCGVAFDASGDRADALVRRALADHENRLHRIELRAV